MAFTTAGRGLAGAEPAAAAAAAFHCGGNGTWSYPTVSWSRAVRHKELITRLLADRCEICKDTDGIAVHHVRRLADLDRPGRPQPVWAAQMARRRRKTLVVCQTCHHSIHTGQPTPQLA